MQKHPYWNSVEENWAGFSPEVTFSSTHFKNKSVELFLGPEFDEDGEEIENPPSEKQLNDYHSTYLSFLKNLEDLINQIQVKTFDRYLKLYAHYYENSAKSGEPPLKINSKEKHFTFINSINYIRILEHNNIQILFRYQLDTEHGLEIRLENNQIIDIGGIAET